MNKAFFFFFFTFFFFFFLPPVNAISRFIGIRLERLARLTLLILSEVSVGNNLFFQLLDNFERRTSFNGRRGMIDFESILNFSEKD